jgi:uncharacterized membrane protein YbhN (UPF0104 family)
MTTWWSALSEAGVVIAHAHLSFVAAAFAVDTVSLVVMSFRWRALLRSFGSGANLWETLLACSAGVFVGNITPARAIGGDACRAALIRQLGGSPSMKAIAASVVYDRASDVAGFVLLAVLAWPLLGPKAASWALHVLLVVAAVMLAPPLRSRLISRTRHQPVIGREAKAPLAAVAGCALAIWLLDITRLMLVGRAFDVHLAPSQAAAIALLRLGSGLIPVPAGIGVVDGALIGGFIWLGLPPGTAAALAVVERAIVYGWGTALGAASLLLLGGVRTLKALGRGRSSFELVSDPVRD